MVEPITTHFPVATRNPWYPSPSVRSRIYRGDRVPTVLRTSDWRIQYHCGPPWVTPRTREIVADNIGHLRTIHSMSTHHGGSDRITFDHWLVDDVLEGL